LSGFQKSFESNRRSLEIVNYAPHLQVKQSINTCTLQALARKTSCSNILRSVLAVYKHTHEVNAMLVKISLLIDINFSKWFWLWSKTKSCV